MDLIACSTRSFLRGRIFVIAFRLRRFPENAIAVCNMTCCCALGQRDIVGRIPTIMRRGECSAGDGNASAVGQAE